MVNWILIGVVLVVLIVIGIKFKEIGHKYKFTAFLFLILLLLGTGGYIWLKTRPDLTTYEGFISLGKSYFAWFGGLFKNMGTITGYAVQQDWGVNGTIVP
jgi:hypothetical protein